MLTEIDYFAIEYLCIFMRDEDRVEIFGLQDHDDPLRMAAEATHMIRNKGRGRVAWWKGRPAALIALVEIRSGVWEVWSWGTEHYRDCAFEMLRWIRREIPDILKHCKAHRLQCHSRVGHDEAHKMIRAMGAYQEGPPLRRFGKDGSDYVCFTWHPGENDGVIFPNYVRPKEA